MVPISLVVKSGCGVFRLVPLFQSRETHGEGGFPFERGWKEQQDLDPFTIGLSRSKQWNRWNNNNSTTTTTTTNYLLLLLLYLLFSSSFLLPLLLPVVFHCTTTRQAYARRENRVRSRLPRPSWHRHASCGVQPGQPARQSKATSRRTGQPRYPATRAPRPA